MRPMPELAIETMPVDELVPYAGNAKRHPPEQVDQIAASIEEFGNCDPIAVWTNAGGEPEIVEGHGRVMALRRLGIAEAPVIRLDHLTDEQRRAYVHVHNQTTLSSTFDFDALAVDIADLPGFDWDALGFELYTDEMARMQGPVGRGADAMEIDIEELERHEFEHKCPRCGLEFD